VTSTYILPEGRHVALCRSVQFGWTEKGKEQIAIGFELTHPDDPDCGARITYFGTFTDAEEGKKYGALDFTMQAIRYIGYTGDDLSELPALAEAGQLAQEVELVVQHEEYNGALSAKVKFVNRPGGGQVQLKKPLDERELKVFAQAMKSRLRADAPRKSSGTPAPAQPTQRSMPATSKPHPNAPGNLDDIPF
jgi:hypothetical protein